MTSIKATFQDETRRRRLENAGGPEEERECFESMFPVLKGQDFEVELIRTKDDLKVFKLSLQTKEPMSSAPPPHLLPADSDSLPELFSILSEDDLRGVVMQAMETDSVKNVLADLIVKALKNRMPMEQENHLIGEQKKESLIPQQKQQQEQDKEIVDDAEERARRSREELERQKQELHRQQEDAQRQQEEELRKQEEALIREQQAARQAREEAEQRAREEAERLREIEERLAEKARMAEQQRLQKEQEAARIRQEEETARQQREVEAAEKERLERERKEELVRQAEEDRKLAERLEQERIDEEKKRAVQMAAPKPSAQPLSTKDAALQQLFDMGFTDKVKCSKMFDQHGPDLDAIIVKLLEQQDDW